MRYSADSEELICVCCDVSARTIHEAVRGGARGYARVRNATGAGGGCGTCADEVEHVVDLAMERDRQERKGQLMLPL